MRKISVVASAKLNLTLEITGTKGNFHTLDMLCTSVDLSEHVTLTENDSTRITLACDHPLVPTDDSNIAYKSAVAFFEATHEKFGVHIDINKNIPVGAGMGGGSANGAAVLFGLNKMAGSPLTFDELCEVGLLIGSDIPVCLKGGLCRVQGTGGVLSPVSLSEEVRQSFGELCFVMMMSGESVSTKEAYGAYDEKGCGEIKADTNKSIDHLKKCDYANFFASMQNDLEYSSTLPLEKAKKELTELGAVKCLMTGSGAVVYGVFTEMATAQKAVSHGGDKFKLLRPTDYGVKLNNY